MKKSCLALILFLMLGSAFAQQKATRIIFNGGAQHAGMYEKTFQNIQCFEGCFPTSQTSALSIDFNLLYQVYSKTDRLSFLYGAGINQKSWNEKGLNSNGAGPINNPYSFRNDNTYLGIFYGINYDFHVGEKIKLFARSLLNPEFMLNDVNEDYKSLAVSFRMTMGLEYQAFDHVALQVTPYFQTALMNYAVSQMIIGMVEPQTYTPYAFGVNLGIVLNKKSK